MLRPSSLLSLRGCLLLSLASIAAGPPALAGDCVTRRASATSTGGALNAAVGVHAIARDGRSVAFATAATNAVPGNTDAVVDLFVRDLATGATSFVAALPSPSYVPQPDLAFSADGRYLAFDAGEDPLQSDLDLHTVWVYDRVTLTLELVGGGPGFQAAAASISGDGRFVAFARAPSSFGIGQVYLRDRLNATTALVSVDATGAPANDDSGMALVGKAAIPFSLGTSVSDDGRFVAFASLATNLGGAPGARNVILRDLVAGTTTALNVDPAGQPVPGLFAAPRLSADGSVVAFWGVPAAGGMLPGVHANTRHAFVHLLASGTVELLDVTPSGLPGSSSTVDLVPQPSTDGRFVAFLSSAIDLVPVDTGGNDVFLRDRATGTTVIASLGSSGAQAGGSTQRPALALDGQRIAFTTTSGLDPADTNGLADVYVRACAPPPRTVCPGDGMATPCPCGNSGASGHGCASSQQPQGARLDAEGTASVTQDTLVLRTTLSTNSVVLYFQSTEAQNGGAGVVLGDGLLCVGGAIVRLGQAQASGGTSQFPSAGQPAIALRGQIPAGGGVTRVYQSRYRNAAIFCTPESFNISNGLELEWLP